MSKKLDTVLEELGKDPETTSTTVNRLKRIASEFVSEDDFFKATRGELMRTWTKIAPQSPRGLGETFFGAFAKAAAERPFQTKRYRTIASGLLTEFERRRAKATGPAKESV